MDEKAQQPVAMVHEVAQGAIAAADAEALLGVSERQVWRLLAAYRRAGAAGRRPGTPIGSRPIRCPARKPAATHLWRTPRRPTSD